MESIVFLLLGAGIFALNRCIKKEHSQKCPKCGKTVVRSGKMIKMSDGRPIWGYKCSCGACWMSE